MYRFIRTAIPRNAAHIPAALQIEGSMKDRVISLMG